MNLALFIVFTGGMDLRTLRLAQDAQTGASQPGEPTLKQRTRVARFRFKHGKLLAKHMSKASGPLEAERFKSTLSPHEAELLEHYGSGRLRKERNEAVTNWGHGRLIREGGDYLDLGGSTKGLTRELMGTARRVNVTEWLRGEEALPGEGSASASGSQLNEQ